MHCLGFGHLMTHDVQGNASFATGFFSCKKNLGTDSKIYPRPQKLPLERDQPVAFLLRHICHKEEIRRSPVEVGKLLHVLPGSFHPRWCRISSINSSCDKGVCLPILQKMNVCERAVLHHHVYL